ncbi:MAG TPA: hypothetical protein PKA83_12235 [Pirellulaceae bacterium]|nr:hypothetical protein [Pirellulaceae bacterium]
MNNLRCFVARFVFNLVIAILGSTDSLNKNLLQGHLLEPGGSSSINSICEFGQHDFVHFVPELYPFKICDQRRLRFPSLEEFGPLIDRGHKNTFSDRAVNAFEFAELNVRLFFLQRSLHSHPDRWCSFTHGLHALNQCMSQIRIHFCTLARNVGAFLLREANALPRRNAHLRKNLEIDLIDRIGRGLSHGQLRYEDIRLNGIWLPLGMMSQFSIGTPIDDARLSNEGTDPDISHRPIERTLDTVSISHDFAGGKCAPDPYWIYYRDMDRWGVDARSTSMLKTIALMRAKQSSKFAATKTIASQTCQADVAMQAHSSPSTIILAASYQRFDAAASENENTLISMAQKMALKLCQTTNQQCAPVRRFVDSLAIHEHVRTASTYLQWMMFRMMLDSMDKTFQR